MKPTLVVMAAGMGSRYGGLKQMDPFGGNLIMEYAVYDAINAGFGKVVFIIKPEMLEDFKQVAGDKIARRVPVSYVFQSLGDLPEGFTVPDGRVKPWGTGHAVSLIAGVVNEPFCVINADDFYGAEPFKSVAEFLTGGTDQSCMAGYRVENTLSESGGVTRGVCGVTDGKLTSVTERMKILRGTDGAIRDTDSGVDIPEGTFVSMNLFGFPQRILPRLKAQFVEFLKRGDAVEFLLPRAIDEMIREGFTSVSVLPTSARWFGVTYREDREPLRLALEGMTKRGLYPELLF
ncbi:nucleotidyltransferase [Clostridia bacterium]|nr:nucleotidyltransferase [Clostridia bacterium]